MIQSPKAQFQKTKFARVHAELVLQEAFLAALNAALLEYVHSQVPQKDQYLDACAANRIAGARHFVDVLLNLAEPRTTPKIDDRSNLRHTL